MTEQIERVIANGKPLAVIKKLLREEYLRLDRVKFDEELFTNYETTYKTVKVTIPREVSIDEYTGETEIVNEAYSYFDYAEDCPTFKEYKNETRVITEAVEATYDEDGNVLTEAIPEVTELFRPYVGLTDEELEAKADEYIKSKYAELRANAYPAIEEQLDMQYKDSLDGGTRFKDAIEAVKLMYPKD